MILHWGSDAGSMPALTRLHFVELHHDPHGLLCSCSVGVKSVHETIEPRQLCLKSNYDTWLSSATAED